MKVLYIVTAYDRHAGDVITPWLVATIRRLRLEGVEVEVLAPAYRGLRGGVVEGIRVHRFRYAPRRWEDLTHDETVPDRLRHRPWYLALVPGYVVAGAWAAARLARRGGYDVLHVHWPVPHFLFGLVARWFTGVALVCSFHGVELTWTRRKWPILLPVLRAAIRWADAVTVNSSYTEELVRRVYDRPIERIPFGAAVDTGAVATPPREARAPAASPFELLFAGRLVERKGVRYLLDALARMGNAYPVRLRVVGDGSERPALEAQAARLGLVDHVRFDGFVPREELARRFAECDAFVLPAVVDAKGDTEGLGVVLVEALAHGKPVIASAAGGIRDIVRDGETGVLVPPADVDALAGAIVRMIREPRWARGLGAAGRTLVEREFSWPAIVRRLVALYHRLAAGRRASR